MSEELELAGTLRNQILEAFNTAKRIVEIAPEYRAINYMAYDINYMIGTIDSVINYMQEDA